MIVAEGSVEVAAAGLPTSDPGVGCTVTDVRGDVGEDVLEVGGGCAVEALGVPVVGVVGVVGVELAVAVSEGVGVVVGASDG
jgi:hypothetical protein